MVDKVIRLTSRDLVDALDEAVALMKAARGHYGIEECAGPGRPATEWDEIQDAMKQFAWRWGGS